MEHEIVELESFRSFVNFSRLCFITINISLFDHRCFRVLVSQVVISNL